MKSSPRLYGVLQSGDGVRVDGGDRECEGNGRIKNSHEQAMECGGYPIHIVATGVNDGVRSALSEIFAQMVV